MARMTRMTRMTRMAHTVARMARWLADLADPACHIYRVTWAIKTDLPLNLTILNSQQNSPKAFTMGWTT